VAVDDAETRTATEELAVAGLSIGESGAAPLAALRVLATAPEGEPLRRAVGLRPEARVLLIATEGRTATGR
jgi:hypothetical protein